MTGHILGLRVGTGIGVHFCEHPLWTPSGGEMAVRVLATRLCGASRQTALHRRTTRGAGCKPRALSYVPRMRSALLAILLSGCGSTGAVLDVVNDCQPANVWVRGDNATAHVAVEEHGRETLTDTGITGDLQITAEVGGRWYSWSGRPAGDLISLRLDCLDGSVHMHQK